jgi:SAM-dependent methyltransferase
MTTQASEAGGQRVYAHQTVRSSLFVDKFNRCSRTQSLTSSTLDFQYENGRRYHAYREGSYHLPNDENEQDRLDLQHELFRMALENQLFLAPLKKDEITDILDVGCGTGLVSRFLELVGP